jgi:hypothetical protein
MTGFFQLLVFLLVWIAGCVVFDVWLKVSGGWMMSAGVLTFWLAAWAAGWITVNIK